MVERFGKRVYDAELVPIDIDAYAYAVELLTLRIRKESEAQAKDVYDARERNLIVRRLRIIRLSMKNHIYEYVD